MKKYLVVILALFSFKGWAQDSKDIDLIQQWLSTIDQGKYLQSWELSDPYFQSQINASKWNSALESARTPLGKLLSRELLDSEIQETVPGIPDGEYLVAVFISSYENKKLTRETVTFSKSTGSWKAIGYFIK